MGSGENTGENVGLNTGTSNRINAAPPPSNGDWKLDPGHYINAQIPLEIINPQQGLTTGVAAASYYYRCYPGLRWRVPISVLGGAWPFRYQLNSGPTGMTLGQYYGDSDYGILEWINPTTGSYSISVTVTDQEDTSYSISWSLEVTTNNTLFIDAVNGNDNNPGSIGSPMRTFAGWYTIGNGSRNDSTYEDYHCYYRTGTYTTEEPTFYDTDPAVTANGRMYMRQKPRVHIAYPGESVTINNSNANFSFDAVDQHDMAFVGIDFKGIVGQAGSGAQYQQLMRMSSVFDRILIFENTFTQQSNAGTSGSNPAYFFLADGPRQTYMSFHNNTIEDMRGMQFIESYEGYDAVVENNTIRDTINVTFRRLVYLKFESEDWSIRNNTCINDQGVTLCFIDAYQSPYDRIEICWNNWEANDANWDLIKLGSQSAAPFGPIYIFRNTLTGGRITHEDGNAGSTPVWYQDNVRQYDTGTDGIRDNNANFSWTGTETDVVATSGLVDDSTNLLTGTARTTYLGTKGHEVD